METPNRRSLFDAARRLITESSTQTSAGRLEPDDLPPRLTSHFLETTRMSRTRDRILSNLDEMYREAFARAQTSGDQAQMTTLDFAYRREQLYLEILLDIRDAIERR
jgi:hypothetical protein